MSEVLPVGKLPATLLAELLSTVPADPSVVVGAGIGRDAAVVRLGDSLVALKSDPITFATDEIGWYAPNVNANDLACMGATPRWMLATVLLPEGATTPDLVRRLFGDLREACDELGVSLVGGHTEIAAGLERTILIGMMVGETSPTRLIDPARSRPDDVVLLVRGIAIEGTALIAREFSGQLAGMVDDETLARARGFLHDPGISVVRAASLLQQRLGQALHALHDPTEGGLATGFRELAASTGCGLSVEREAVLIYPETRALCEAFALDPFGLIASGALLAVVSPEVADIAMASLAGAGIEAAVVGRLLRDPVDLHMLTHGREDPLPAFPVDEIARLFASQP